MSEEKKKGIFDEVFSRTPEILKLVKKPLVRSQVKGKLTSGYNDAENKRIDAESVLEDLRTNLKDYDINKILEQKQLISETKRLQRLIADEYKELFGKSMPKEE